MWFAGRMANKWRAAAMGAAVLAGVSGGAPGVGAQVEPEPIGRVERLPTPWSERWALVSDAVMRRLALVDLDTGHFLGQLEGGYGITRALLARSRPEIYVPETHYSRGSRGERTDVVTVYEAPTLRPVAEVVIPPRRAINALPMANAALSDDDRFLAVFNMTPAQSLSIVDVERRALAGVVDTPGCSLVYAAGPRRFAMLCADGSLLTLTLDAAGGEAHRTRSEPFFDPIEDPITEKGVRIGDRWIFVSFEGRVHEVDLSGAEPRFAEPWPLASAAERADRWRPGGHQHLAVHRPTRRLYSLMHQGGPGSHKDPGRELWVYDLERRERVERLELRSPGLTYMGVSLAFGQDWLWPFNLLYDGFLSLGGDLLGVGSVDVTQDDRPILVTASRVSGAVALYDALSGEFLRRFATGNMTILSLQTTDATATATAGATAEATR